jgi:multiple sugar transport system substrate-binding protein
VGLIKYLTTNNHARSSVEQPFSLPTTSASLHSPELTPDAHFTTFLKIFGNPRSSTSPIMASGVAYTNLVQNFFTKWQAGDVKDLAGGLNKLDTQLDAQVAQARGGGVP